MMLSRALTALPIFVAVATAGQAQVLEVGPSPADDVFSVPEGALDQAVEALPGIVARVMERSGVPGLAVAVVHGSDVVFAEGYGVRDLESGAPVTPDTVFQIASISKSLSATVASIAKAKGQVDWDDKVSELLPDFRLGSDYVTAEATVGDFFAHRSGLPGGAGDDLEDLGFDRATILSRLDQMPLNRFRTSYAYANFGTTTAGEAVAAAAGGAWEDVAQEYLFGPMGMDHTSYRHDDFLTRDNRATLHELEDGQFKAVAERDPDPQAPAGGVTSTVLDLARWMSLLNAGGTFDGQELFAETDILPAMKPQSQNSLGHSIATRGAGYGYGFNYKVLANGRVGVSHSGAFIIGAGTAFEIMPSLDTGIVVLTNGGPVGAAESIIAEFFDIANFEEVTRDWYAGYNAMLVNYYAPVGDLVGQTAPADAEPSRPLTQLTGTYDSPYFGPARVEDTDGGLVLYLGPKDMAFPLEHWTGDTFAVAPRSENAPYGSLSSVVFGGDGDQATSLYVDYLDTYGLGTWER
ncbi:serine hydrolase [Chachezhania sediminis]|uniref:serine hydrolase n=1 Tax=Chachezhania sediminis TaxID=2599291 RepID=UPI0018EEF6CE|nr:serine hydrolase [Chachezhania sediminis]